MLENNKKMGIAEIGVILLFAMYYILPSVSATYNFKLPIMLGFVYAICTFFKKPIYNEVVKYLALIAFVAMLYALLTDTNSITVTGNNYFSLRFISKFYQIFMMFFPLFILNRVQTYATEKQKLFILAVMYVLIAYVLIVTLQELYVNPNVTRSWEDFSEKAQGNVGGYYFVYAIPIVITVCTMLIFKTKKVLLKVLLIALIIFQIFFLLMAQYTLSLIVTVAGMAYEIYVNIKYDRNKVIVLMIGVVLVISLPSILKFAAQRVPSEQMAVRLREVYSFFTAGDSSGYNLNSRLTLYKDTFLAFLNSPFWGNRYLDFDGHATFITVLADLGLLGGIPFYYMYFHAKKRASTIISDNEKLFNPVFLVILLTGFTNPIHAALPLMLTAWFIAPMTVSMVYNIKGEVENEQLGN